MSEKPAASAGTPGEPETQCDHPSGGQTCASPSERAAAAFSRQLKGLHPPTGNEAAEADADRHYRARESVFARAARGEVDLHVWRSTKDPAILIDTLEAAPGTKLSTEEWLQKADDLSVHHDYQPYYDGIMTVEEATARQADHERAWAQASIGGSGE